MSQHYASQLLRYGWTTWVEFPREEKILHFATVLRFALGPIHSPVHNVYRGPTSWVKASGVWSRPFTSILCHGWGCVKLYFHSLYIFTASCVAKQRNNFSSSVRDMHAVCMPPWTTVCTMLFSQVTPSNTSPTTANLQNTVPFRNRAKLRKPTVHSLPYKADRYLAG